MCIKIQIHLKTSLQSLSSLWFLVDYRAKKETTPTGPTNCNYTIKYCILGDPGPVSGAGKVKTVEKKIREKKSQLDKVVTDQFQTVGVVLASDLFFLPNHKAARPGVFSRLLTRWMHIGQLLAICLLEESSNHSTECLGDRSVNQ